MASSRLASGVIMSAGVGVRLEPPPSSGADDSYKGFLVGASLASEPSVIG
jgi:hypothetical protein